MKHRSIFRRILTIGTFLVAAPLPANSATPELVFPSGVSWKEIFDSGLRPKHIAGLERKKAECRDQQLDFRFKKSPLFHLDEGRLMFELRSDDSIRIIEHISRVPITMDEGTKRMKEFHDLFTTELKRSGSVPPLMDPERGGVAATSDYYAAAEDQGYTIHYGFTGSAHPVTPLVPVFMIALRHRMNSPDLPIRRKIVEPPAGYESHDMTPISYAELVRAALEEEQREDKHEIVPKRKTETEPAGKSSQADSVKISDSPNHPKSSFLRWMIGGFVLLVILLLLFKIWEGKPER
jgi:hypothetical protein